jgi:hypothetical protein
VTDVGLTHQVRCTAPIPDKEVQVRYLGTKLSYANVVATIALFCALGGGAYAAVKIRGSNVVDSSLTGRDLKNNSVRSADVAGLKANDFAKGQLQAGPKGDPGPQGPKGDTGAQGPPGPIAGTPAGGMLAGTYPNPSLATFPGARVERNGPFTIEAGPDNSLDLVTEVFDTGGMYTPPEDFVTVTRPGMYLLHAFLDWGGAGDTQRQVRLLVNDEITTLTTQTVPGNSLSQEATAIRRLEAGDTVGMGSFNGSGADTSSGNLTGLSEASLTVQWIGA